MCALCKHSLIHPLISLFLSHWFLKFSWHLNIYGKMLLRFGAFPRFLHNKYTINWRENSRKRNKHYVESTHFVESNKNCHLLNSSLKAWHRSWRDLVNHFVLYSWQKNTMCKWNRPVHQFWMCFNCLEMLYIPLHGITSFVVSISSLALNCFIFLGVIFYVVMWLSFCFGWYEFL